MIKLQHSFYDFMRVLHIITGLGSGGAEGMLLKLLSASPTHWQSAVVSLGETGVIGSKISELNIPVHALNVSPKWPSPAELFSLITIVRRLRPEIIQGWMPHGNLAAVLAGMSLRKRVPVLWNVRMSLDDLASEPRITRMLIRLGARLSWYPNRIIYNSQAGARQHEEIGYRTAQTVLIPNGFDCEIFRPSADARRAVHSELGIADDALLVGLIARYHPMKDHGTFLRAAGITARHCENVYFLLAGAGVNVREPALAELTAAEHLDGRAFFWGERSDIPRLTAALDIACSASSRAEGFSNAVGEAMASGVPCVATDVGDSASIIGETGISIPARDPEALARALGRLITDGADRRRRLGLAARQRVEKEFSLPVIVQRYEDLYRDLLQRNSR